MTWTTVLKSRLGKMRDAIEAKYVVEVIGMEKTKRHNRIHLRNPATGTTRFVTTSVSPKVKGKFNLIVRGVGRAFRQVGEELEEK
jgi:hypothetical protein